MRQIAAPCFYLQYIDWAASVLLLDVFFMNAETADMCREFAFDKVN